MAGNQKVTTENIDGVILRLLKIKSGTELDYQTYFKNILNKLATVRIAGKYLPAEEDELLREELKRVKKLQDKGRFVVKEKKVKVSSTPPPKTGPGRPSGGGGNNRPPKTGALVKTPKGKVSTEKFFHQFKVEEVSVKDVTKKSAKVSKKDDPLDRIIKRLDSIIKTLTDLNKENKKESERQRKDSESKKRREREESLESKVFDGIKSAVKKMMAPFRSIWDYITNFLWNVFLGKVVLKLLDWFSDPKNKDKIGSIIRFFKDWWPTMLGAYILFGTSFGKLARTVVGFAIKGAIGFGKVIARLIAAIAKGKSLKVAGAFAGGRKGFGGKSKFGGGGWKGALLKGGLAIGGTLLAGYAIDKGVESLMGSGEETKNANINVPDSPKIPMLNAATGGLADFGKVLGKFSLEKMLGPLGILMSMGMGSIPEMFKGLVTGKKGIDKIPAMLTDGEFVMSKGAVQKYGVDTLEAMNAAGGGTNIPKVVEGKLGYFGGGMVGDNELYRMAANYNRGENVPEINYDPNNPDHVSSYEKMKKRAIKRGSYIDPIEPPQSHSRSSRQSARYSPPGGRTPPPNASSLMRRPTSALSTNVRTPMQSIRTNMNVSGGFGNLRSLGVEMLANYLMERGFDRINAILIANKIDEGKKLTGDKRENYIEKLRNIVDKEERWQKGFGGIFDSIVGMGKETQSQKLSKSARATLEGIGSSSYAGGGIVGGYGLKDQSFRDAPKTQVMTDEKGRPFVGYKALQNGKLTYRRGPEPGTASNNPLEIIGRFLFPGAYKSNDAKLADEKHKDALVNSLQSFRDRGMGEEGQSRMMKSLGGNIKDTQKDLDARKARISGETSSGSGRRSRSRSMNMSKSQARKPAVKPLPKPAPTIRSDGGPRGSNKRRSRGGSGNTSAGSVKPVSASRNNTGAQKRQLGISHWI
jgi:hypothetical protein